VVGNLLADVARTHLDAGSMFVGALRLVSVQGAPRKEEIPSNLLPLPSSVQVEKTSTLSTASSSTRCSFSTNQTSWSLHMSEVASTVSQNLHSPPAPNILLMGDSGTGKTTSLISLPPLGITPFVIATEQNCEQILKQNLGRDMHFAFVAPKANDPLTVIDMLNKINKLSYENLCKTVDPFKMQHNKFIDVMQITNDFKCECCGKSWGTAKNWNTDRALVGDSFSGMSDMAFALVIGNKPVRDKPDYQVAQNALRMVYKTWIEFRCWVILITHLDKEPDPISGAFYATVKTIGRALGPDMPRDLADVIRAKRDGSKITWDTADTQATVVGRHVPLASGLAPDSKQPVQTWIAKGGKIEATQSVT
jgi:hypothetical protein